MSITLKELIGNTSFSKLDKDVQANLMLLLERINKVRQAYGSPMSITSGLRTKEDHIRIYKDIAKKNGKPFDISKVPMGSAHLKGAACDVSDPKQQLQAWCLANVPLLEKVELWCEAFEATPTWCHFQVYPYASWVPGKSRWFKP